MNILVFIGFLVAVFIVAKLMNLWEHRRDKQLNVMSFKEAIDLTNVPVITFEQNNKKINLLLDTGASLSVIDKKFAKKLKTVPNENLSSTVGISGELVDNIPNVNIIFTYMNNTFEDTFQVIDMTKTFDYIKSNTGVTIHGILGTSFMQKYKYIIDFEKFIAYKR